VVRLQSDHDGPGHRQGSKDHAGVQHVEDLLTGDNDGTGVFTGPQRPVRRRLHGVERFVTTRGGEYLFLPSLSALGWLANLGG
jgi:hypothetical protein